MKIKNNTPANLSVFAMSTRGSANKKSMVVPGEASLTLNDAEWKEEYAMPSAKLIEAGHLEITEDVVLSEEEEEAIKEAELEAAQKLVDEAKAEKLIDEAKAVKKPASKY